MAEVANLHEGSLGLARALVDSVAKRGADAVKFQIHSFEDESLSDAPNPSYFNGESRRDYLTKTSFDADSWMAIREHCRETNIGFVASVFSEPSLEILLTLDADAIKVPSGEVTNLPLLENIAKAGKPVFLSTGMSSYSEIDEAVSIFTDSNCDLVLFQCTSQYPCESKNVGLNVFEQFSERYPNISLGFSDHTTSDVAAILAIGCGVKIFEKHFTLSKEAYGPDCRFSADPNEFERYVISLKEAEEVVRGFVDKDSFAESISDMRRVFQKSIVAASDLRSGDVITIDSLKFKKPDLGISASKYRELVGKRLSQDVNKDAYIIKEFIHGYEE